jgi:hypothetical protein
VLSKRLRVFSTVVATLTYCARNAGHLFVVAWFPCALDSACRLALEWLIYSFPPRLPEWSLFGHFEPPTWLTPVVAAPLVAMVWAFVLSDICDRNSDRGIIVMPNVVLWPVTIAIVMNASASPSPTAELDRRATRPA